MKALSTIGTFALRLQHVFVQPLSARPLNCLPDPDQVYFSRYPFEQADVHPKVLQDRIFVATRREDVEPDGLAAFGISPNRKELGQQGADLLIKDFRGEQPLGRTDMRFPARLYYWINCRSASRRHLSFS